MRYALLPLLVSLLMLACSFVLTWQHQIFAAVIAFVLSAVFAKVGQQYFADQEGEGR